MKILYIAHERCAAQVAESALRRLVPDVQMSWAQSTDAALGWVRDNGDAGAVLADCGREGPEFDVFLEEVRSLGLTTPIAAVAPEHLQALSTALKGSLDGLVDQERTRSEGLAAELAASTGICAALQDRLVALEAALHAADERHTAQAAATERLVKREADLSTVVTEAAAARAALEERLTEAEVARLEAEQRFARAEDARKDDDRKHASALAALTTRLIDTETRHEAASARNNRICTALQQRLLELEGAIGNADQRHAADAAASLLLAEQLRHREAALATLEEQAEASGRDAARLQQEAEGLRRQLNALRTHAAALRRHAERLPVLEQQLDESKKKNRRQFERAPYGLCEVTREGVITRVNHSLARLLGYRSHDLQRVDIVATIFESAADLPWLLERTMQTGKVASVETTLRTQDRRRLFVRLHALGTDELMVIAVEDLTQLSAVEQRLRDSQRMEAVGRVASEVAVTCDTLLRDVSQDGRQWLAAFESDTPLRQQGELLLGDVTRAAGFLRQFVNYGHQQIDNAEPVSVPHLLRDIAPVLKRVLGDDITLLLPKTTDGFEVDVDGERVERMLVNVANYARERMPHGGRVRLQLATAVVDRKFLASHPKVRPGAHVRMTITEIQGAVWPALPIHLPIGRKPHADPIPASSDKPGMDLGPLVALIGDAGGHLWMSAEPAGNITLQIHLPKRTQDETLEPAGTDSWSNRGRHLTKWFRH